MHVVIVGAGVVGLSIARHLVDEKKDVVLVERDPKRAKFVSNHVDCMVINQEGNHMNVLKQAGIERADILICVTNSDELNMITCGLVASEYNVPVKIARVRNIDYSRPHFANKLPFGIDYIVNSEVETARKIANTVALGATSDVMLFEDTDIQMRNIIVDNKSFFKNRSIKEIKKKIKEQFLISGILRENNFLIPSGDTVVDVGDNIYFFATRDTLTKIFMEAGKKSETIDKIIIVGGGRIGTLVCQYLIRTGLKITMIESDYEKCEELSIKFPDALILHEDISEEGLFEDEQLYDYDLIISTTENQELNIITSVYAKSMGIKRAVALLEKSNYLTIASTLKIDSTISPKNSTVDAILKYIRRGDIQSVHSLFDYRAEVIEYTVSEKSTFCGTKILDLNLPPNTLILSIIRDNKDFIPGGETVINDKDRIIIIVRKDSIEELEDLIVV